MVDSTPLVQWEIGPLEDRHDRCKFDCGKPPLNQFLVNSAISNDRRDYSRTFVMAQLQQSEICGFYSLSSSSIDFDELPPAIAKKAPRYPMPVALLGKLAVDRTWHGRGLGGRLLFDALLRIERIARDAGVAGLAVDAIDDDAKRFYLKYGFLELLDNPLHLLLPMKQIRKITALLPA